MLMSSCAPMTGLSIEPSKIFILDTFHRKHSFQDNFVKSKPIYLNLINYKSIEFHNTTVYLFV